jgi:hypothetical protein
MPQQVPHLGSIWTRVSKRASCHPVVMDFVCRWAIADESPFA